MTYAFFDGCGSTDEMSIKGKMQHQFEFLMNSKSSRDGQLGEEYSSSTDGHKRDTTNWRQANQRRDTSAREVTAICTYGYGVLVVYLSWSFMRVNE